MTVENYENTDGHGVMKPREELTGSMDLYSSSMLIVTVALHVMAIRLTYADSDRCLDRYSTPIDG